MTEYITKEQAYNSVDERIKELKADNEFNIVKEICISGVKKHIDSIPTADVVERSKVDKAIAEIEDLDPITESVGREIKQEILRMLKEI